MAGALAALALVGGPIAAAPPATQGNVQVERVTVESFDGVELGGWLLRPAGIAGDLPTVLISSPYLGQCVKASSFTFGPCWPTPDTPEDRAMHPEPVDFLVGQGYAVAWFSVRGTGVSSGCWEDMGLSEQRDQAHLVEWIADQPWSNGNVGAMGLSYMSGTALEAAVQAPEALKTIVIAGVIGDLYSYFHTPQGLASSNNYILNEAAYGTDLSLVPVGLGTGNPSYLDEHAERAGQRVCPGLVDPATQGFWGATTGDRDAAFWLERRLNDRYDDIEASVLVAHGLKDLIGSGHKMQEDVLWSALDTEKGMILGQWGHSWPWMSDPSVESRPDLKEWWLATLVEWLDHYLKDDGKGKRPALVGKVLYEDDTRAWHASDRWPLKSSHDQTLYLTSAGELRPAAPATDGTVSFRSAPTPDRGIAPAGLACPSLADPATRTSVLFTTAPVPERTLVTGNPVALLDLAADQDGGGLQVTLFDIAPDATCTPVDAGAPVGIEALTVGGADLRYHRGNFAPAPFEDGLVRVDLANIAEVLEPGHRLGMAVSYPRTREYVEFGHTPLIDIRTGPRVSSSQLVVQIAEGPGFGGQPSTADFPPRPI